ncbi:MAG: hypothetical protein J5878_03925 [Oscillospiraceae bacterium]|nr:hypothetical protein [Oscillospiraceae bacterium]
MKLRWDLPGKIPVFLDRYKLPILTILIGLTLLLWSPGEKAEGSEFPVQTQPEQSQPQDEGERYCARTEQELETLLAQIDGAGRVRVMLTLRTGPAANYQKDSKRTNSGEGERHSESLEEKTVILSRASAYNEPAIVSTAYPEFQGALIVAEGGADAKIRYQLAAAVSALLGLGADQITVVKMK